MNVEPHTNQTEVFPHVCNVCRVAGSTVVSMGNFKDYMTATQKHTPGRLRVVGTGHSFVTLELDDRPITAAIGQRKIATAERETDGQRLAHCWNCHEELLEACKAITRELEYAYGGHGQMPTMEAKFYEQAKSAIAKAEGKE